MKKLFASKEVRNVNILNKLANKIILCLHRKQFGCLIRKSKDPARFSVRNPFVSAPTIRSESFPTKLARLQQLGQSNVTKLIFQNYTCIKTIYPS